MKSSNFVFFFFTIASSTLATLSTAATFTVRNQCSYTIWAAALPGGGQQLNQGQTWTFNVANGTRPGRIWARTKCNFDAPGGTTTTRPRCETGDCGGVLQCQTDGAPPKTLVEYALNQFNNMDFYDISLVDGFNVPVELSPITTTGTCRSTRCAADITAECPFELRAPGGCNHPCNVFNKSKQYCCDSGSTCAPSNYSRFFKSRCPEAYSFPMPDGPASTLVCPGGTNYGVVFCP